MTCTDRVVTATSPTRSGREGPARRALRCAVCVGLLSALFAPEGAMSQEVSFGAQVRPRYEYRDPLDGSHGDFVSMRVRTGLTALLEGDVQLFVQLQDVRIWGEEGNTLSDYTADQLDLHQGWLQLGLAEGLGTRIRVGRQETSLGGERLVGAVGWTQQGRAFDGVRLSVARGLGSIDLLAFKTAEDFATDRPTDAELFGGYAVAKLPRGSTLDLYSLYVRERGEASTGETTLGARWVGTSGPWRWRAEGSYQTGERQGMDASAYLLGARLGTALPGGAEVTLWYDLVSGDPDPEDDKVQSFNTLFATNHKFYGFADLFLDLPVHTAGHGLQDAAVKAAIAPSSRLNLGLDLHSFHVARDRGLDSGHLAEELDLTVRFRHSAQLTVSGGLSRVFAHQALADIGRLSRDQTWCFLMLDAGF